MSGGSHCTVVGMNGCDGAIVDYVFGCVLVAVSGVNDVMGQIGLVLSEGPSVISSVAIAIGDYAGLSFVCHNTG